MTTLAIQPLRREQERLMSMSQPAKRNWLILKEFLTSGDGNRGTLERPSWGSGSRNGRTERWTAASSTWFGNLTRLQLWNQILFELLTHKKQSTHDPMIGSQTCTSKIFTCIYKFLWKFNPTEILYSKKVCTVNQLFENTFEVLVFAVRNKECQNILKNSLQAREH